MVHDLLQSQQELLAHVYACSMMVNTRSSMHIMLEQTQVTSSANDAGDTEWVGCNYCHAAMLPLYPSYRSKARVQELK